MQPSSGPQMPFVPTTASPATLIPFSGLKVPNPTYPALSASGSGLSAVAAAVMTHPSLLTAEFHHRAHLYDLSRLQYGFHGYHPHAFSPYHPAAGSPGFAHAFLYGRTTADPRTRFLHEEPKPSHSYIGLIAMAILSVKEKKLVLSDIYQWILDNYAYFRTRGPGWRNSIRHNLSLNDCFIKAGRSANGKGHYWGIHPANIEDFKKGDFRRRKAQRKVRKHMGLSVPEDEDSPSPSPTAPPSDWQRRMFADSPCPSSDADDKDAVQDKTIAAPSSPVAEEEELITVLPISSASRKRMFDVESLLAPDDDSKCNKTKRQRVEEDFASTSETKLTEDDNTDPEERKVNDNKESREIKTEANTCSRESPPVARQLITGGYRHHTGELVSFSGTGFMWPRLSPHTATLHGAFPQTSSATVTSWSTLASHSQISPRFLRPTTSVSPRENKDVDSFRWQESLAKIMAKSYDKKLSNPDSE
ncbi:forkhead box protein I1 [Lingula anatina]|uniref:Forkhead box protein I1 n=1 Tax=Lingula anatina TaxID=7574 RepID=A0A1S3KH44_LINAN|nr:forkhead box protein I1 [Lingula anatina]|eukprot:XP_013421812.1 forkhead box protein I1 [Lingula anatina]